MQLDALLLDGAYFADLLRTIEHAEPEDLLRPSEGAAGLAGPKGEKGVPKADIPQGFAGSDGDEGNPGKLKRVIHFFFVPPFL